MERVVIADSTSGGFLLLLLQLDEKTGSPSLVHGKHGRARGRDGTSSKHDRLRIRARTLIGACRYLGAAIFDYSGR